MAKQTAEKIEKVEEVKVNEVAEATEEVKESFLAKAKTKVKGVNFKAAAKVVVIGAVTGAIGYALGKKSNSDSVDYELCEFTNSTSTDDNAIDITEF